MKNKITIEGQEFELPDSLVQEIKSKLGKKEPETFQDCLNLYKEAWICSASTGEIYKCDEDNVMRGLRSGVAVPSKKRAEQLAAIAKMMTVADALNGGWVRESGYDYIIVSDGIGAYETYANTESTRIWFKDRSTAERAIKILGEYAIKTAFGL